MQTVGQASTTTSNVTSSVDPSVYGQAVTFSVTVSAAAPGAGISTGTVTFSDQNGALGSGSLNGSGLATFTTSALSTSMHTVTASYGGDSNFSGSNDSASATPLLQTVGQASTTTSNVTSSVDPSVYGQAVTFSVTVSAAAPGAGISTGTVTFSDQNGALGSGSLNGSGLATFTTSALSTSMHTVTASYGGDSNFSGSNDSASATPLLQTVGQASTTTSNVTSSVDPSVYGQAVTFSVTVSAVAPGAGISTGTVTFSDQNGALGSGSLNGSGLATFTTSALSTSMHTVTASYGGDSNFSGSNDSASATPLLQTVGQASTTTSNVTSSVDPSVYGQAVTFSVTVSAAAPGAGIPTGTVTFSDQNGALGSGSLNGSGLATFTTSALSTSMHTVTASYGGDSNFSGSNDSASATPLLQTVGQASTTTSNVTSSVDPSVYGQAVTFSVTVSAAAPGAGISTGTVTFSDQNGALGSGSLNGSGLATFTTSALSTSMHTVTASYGGDSNFSGSNDSASATPLLQTVGQAHTATTFTVTPSSSTFGQAVTFTARVIALLPGAGLPSGGVTFTDGTVTVGTASLDSTGHATFTTATLNAGGHAISA